MMWKMLLSSIPQDTRILFLESESYKEGVYFRYEVHTVISLFRNKRFALNEMFQWNASKGEENFYLWN